MNLCDVNPHIRYAAQTLYISDKRNVQVKDCRIFYVISGEALIFISNQQYTLSENTFFYCCAGSTYTIESLAGAELMILNFDLSQKRNTIIHPLTIQRVSYKNPDTIHNTDIIDDFNLLNNYIIKNNSSSYYGIIKEIVEEFSSKRIFFRERSSALLKELLVDLYRKNSDTSTSSYDIISNIIKYIKNNFKHQIKNSELAQIAGYHEYHLNRLFIKHTGTSIHKYILQIRTDKAKQLLLNTNMSLKTIADECGFGSSTHFAAHFKQSLEMSPSEYRKKFKNKI